MKQRDSIINVLNVEIDTLKNGLNYYTALYNSEKSHNSNFANIATGNQAELYNKINELEATVSRLQNENKSLRKKISELEEKEN